MNGECLLVIPARGGSKGIPGKNLKQVGGYSLVERAVRTARAAQLVARVVVSTDDEAIAAIAKRAGAEVIARPADIAGDEASSESAVLHVVETLAAQGYSAPLLAIMQCTTPLTQPADVDAAIERLQSTGSDCCLTVTAFHGFVWRPDNGPSALPVNHNLRTRLRRQEREPEWLENGALYVMRTEGFLLNRHRFFGTVTTSVMPAERSWEVDEPTDLVVVQALLAAPSVAPLPEQIEALVLDFDGVLTDNRVLVLEDGSEGVFAHRGDGMGIDALRNRLPVLVLSAERNPVVTARATKLGVECVQGEADKASALKSWMAARRINPSNVVFVGNDVNDLGCFALVGCAIAVADAHPDALRAANHVLHHRGGSGAIREIADLITREMR